MVVITYIIAIIYITIIYVFIGVIIKSTCIGFKNGKDGSKDENVNRNSTKEVGRRK